MITALVLSWLKKAGAFIADHWVFFLILALLCSNYVFFTKWRSEVAAYDVLVATGKHQNEITDAAIAHQKQINEDTRNGYQAALAYLNAHPQRVLQRACGGTLPTVSGAAARADDAGQGAVPTPADVEKDASEAVLQLNQLQDWVERQHAINKQVQ